MKMDIKNYEAMAKLNLPDDEREAITNLAGTLIKSFEALSGIDTAGTEPMYTVLSVRNVLREDVSVKIISREELLSSAPAQYEGYFQVPKTLV